LLGGLGGGSGCTCVVGYEEGGLGQSVSVACFALVQPTASSPPESWGMQRVNPTLPWYAM
jgi:hypothetical protein